MVASKKNAGFAARIGGKFDSASMQPSWLLKNNVINKSQLPEVDLVQLDTNKTKFEISGTRYEVDSKSLHIYSVKQEPQFVVNQMKKISKLFGDTASDHLIISRFNMCKFQNESDIIKASKKLVPLHPWKSLLQGGQNCDIEFKTGFKEIKMTALEQIKSGILKKRIHIKPNENKNNLNLFILVRFSYSLDLKNITVLNFQDLLTNEYEMRVSEADSIINDTVGE